MKTKTYESMVLLDNREVRRGWQALKDNVTGTFQKHEAEIISARRWEEARLAYPIRGQQRATYLLVYFKAPTEQLSAIRRDLEYDESVLRHLMLAVDDVPESAHEPEEDFDESSVRVEEVGHPVPEEETSDEASGSGEKGEKSEKGDKSGKSESDDKSDEPESGEKSEKSGKEGEAEAEAEGDTAKAGATEAGDSAGTSDDEEKS